jgi:hypothetical protein
MTPPKLDPTTESDRNVVARAINAAFEDDCDVRAEIIADAVLAALAQRGRLVMDDSEAEMQPALPMRVGGLPLPQPPRVPGEQP